MTKRKLDLQIGAHAPQHIEPDTTLHCMYARVCIQPLRNDVITVIV